MATKPKSRTNRTTGDILKFLFSQRVFAWRQNVAPIPIHREGSLVGFRSGGKAGIPDIIGIIPPALSGLFTAGRNDEGGIFLGIEIKTGRDRLRPEQAGFHQQTRTSGGIILVVKDYQDFLDQWNEFQTPKIQTPSALHNVYPPLMEG